MEIVTIDGPTSSGKNSVGFLLSQKLGFQYIDTGMIYRVGTYLVLDQKIESQDILKVSEVFKNLSIEIKPTSSELRIFNNSIDLTDKLHLPEVTQTVPVVAAIKEVRELTKITQRELGEKGNTVMTGRDIGSEIFPEAKNKFFLTAKVEVRARRRFEQLVKKDSSITFEKVLEDMKTRDEKDSTRAVSPLRIPEGAVVIDNSELTVEQTVEEMLKNIHV